MFLVVEVSADYYFIFVEFTKAFFGWRFVVLTRPEKMVLIFVAALLKNRPSATVLIGARYAFHNAYTVA